MDLLRQLELSRAFRILCALETVLKHWKSSVSARSHTGKPQISLLVNDQNREHWWGGVAGGGVT